MLPITLETLQKESKITFLDNGLLLSIHPEWVIPDEVRVSYTTALKLVECCREYHWRKDISHQGSVALDSTVRNLSAEFTSPIFIGDDVFILYKVTHIGNSSYTLQINLLTNNSAPTNANFTLTNVFVDHQGSPMQIPDVIRASLQKLASQA